MKVTTEKLEGSKVSLEVECSHEVVDEALAGAYKKVVRKVTIPGFRRGKAPRNLVERFYGAELYEEAMQEALPREYIKAVEEAQVDPVGDPEFSDIHLVKGEPLRFKAIVYVVPEVKLEDYSSITVPFEAPSVSDEDVDKQIDMLKERMAELRPMQDGISLEAGHYATCHVKSLDSAGKSGEEPKEGKFEFDEDMNYVEVGREYNFVPGLGQALIGMEKGEAKDFEGAYPAKEGEEPRKFRFQVEVKEVYEKYVPGDNDEIARNLGKASAEEMREDIKKNLIDLRMKMAREQHASKVEEELVKKASVEIPEVMISRRAQTLLDRFQDRLAETGMKLENYLESTKKSSEDLKAELDKEAEKDVRRDLILDAVGRQENIEVSEESMDKVVESLAAEMGQDPKAVKTTLELRGALDDIQGQLKRIETLNVIAARAALSAGTPLPAPEKDAEADEEDATGSTDAVETGESSGASEDAEAAGAGASEPVKDGKEEAVKDAEPGDMVESNKDKGCVEN